MLTEIANAANVHPACRSYVDASFCRQKRVPTENRLTSRSLDYLEFELRYLQNSATHTETILKDKQRDRCEGEYVRWSPFTTLKTQSLLWTQQESLQQPLS